MMNFKVRLFSIFLMLIMLCSSTSVSASMMDNFMPDEPDKRQEGTVQLEYNEYPLSRYGMDTHLEETTVNDFLPWGLDENVTKQLDSGMALLNSTLWQINKLFSNMVGLLVSASFDFDIISDFSDDVSLALKEIVGFGPNGYTQNGLWFYFLPTVICIIGVWGAYVGVIKRASSQALGGILTSIITMTLALGFFTNADKLLVATNDGISEVQNDILSFTLSATLPGEYKENEGVAVMRNQMYNLMIKYPYLLLNYGTVNEKEIESQWRNSGSRIDAILKTSPLSQERMDAVKYEVKELNNENMKPGALNDRFVILVLSLLMNAIMGSIIVLLSCSLIGYQIMILIYAIFTSITLLVGLIPSFAPTARKNIKKLAHAFYMKIALTLLISIYFSISKMVYNNMNAQEGYALLFVLQIVITVLVWVKRHELLNVVTAPFQSANVNNTIGQNIKEYKQAFFKGQKYFNKATKPIRTPAKPLEERTSYKLQAKPGIGVVNPMTHPSTVLKERKANTTEQAEPVKQPIKPDVKSNLAVRKPNVESNLSDPNNIKSLAKTTEKGGHAYQVKGGLKQQMVDRKTGVNK